MLFIDVETMNIHQKMVIFFLKIDEIILYGGNVITKNLWKLANIQFFNGGGGGGGGGIRRIDCFHCFMKLEFIDVKSNEVSHLYRYAKKNLWIDTNKRNELDTKPMNLYQNSLHTSSNGILSSFGILRILQIFWP